MNAIGAHARAVCLVAVALLLPFETTSGALRVGGLTITLLEVALLLCAAVEIGLRAWQGAVQAGWITDLRAHDERDNSRPETPPVDVKQRRWWRMRSPTLPGWILLFAACALLSAGLAPQLAETLAQVDGAAAARPVAWKSAARLIVDALAGLSAFGLVRQPPRWLTPRRLVGVVVMAASAAAMMGIAEQQWRDGGVVEPLLSHFRVKATLAGALRRLTGPFEQANITAGFLALALPMSIALVWPEGSRARMTQGAAPNKERSAVVAWPWLLATTLLLWALLGTYSRGALLASGLSLGLALAVIVRRRWRRRETSINRVTVIVAGFLLSVSLIRLGVDSALRHRLGLPPQGPQIAWTATIAETASAEDKTPARTTLKIHNTGWLTWRPGGTDPMRIHAIARAEDGRIVSEERTALPGHVAPGETLTINVARPTSAAVASVRWRLEQHGRRSFDASPPAVQRLSETTTQPWPTDGLVGGNGGNERPIARRADLWPVAARRFLTRPIVGWGADTFRLRWPQDRPNLRPDYRVHANSLWLELLADLGLLGFVAFAGGLLWAMTRGLRGGPLAVGAALALITWAMHGGADSLLYFHGPAALCWLCAGLAGGLGFPSRERG